MNEKSPAETQALAYVTATAQRLENAARRMRRVSAPASVRAAARELLDAQGAYERSADALLQIQATELAARGFDAVKKAYESASNWAYEATMGDYSTASISRATDALNVARLALSLLGYTVEHPSYGVWVYSEKTAA